MSFTNNNPDSSKSFDIKRIKPRYITINEDIFLKLSIESLKTYMALRYESDSNTECSSVKKNIKFLENKTKLSRRTIFYCLKELESLGLVEREANPGYQSTYLVAQDLGYFSSKTQEPQAQLPPDNPPETQPDNLSTTIDQSPVHDVHTPVHMVHYPVHDVHHITNILSTNSSHIKTIVDYDKSTRTNYVHTSYVHDELFMIFYSRYPNKQKPEIARKAFYKHKPDLDFVYMLCRDIKARTDNNWHGRHKNKIPHPATYLNGKEWEGEIYPPEQSTITKTKYKTMDDIAGDYL